jgi:hypothetical protein
VAVHCLCLLLGPSALLGKDLPYVALQVKNAPQGPWSDLTSAVSPQDDAQAIDAEAIGRSISALGSAADRVLGPGTGTAIQFRRTAEKVLSRKALALIHGEEASAACKAIGVDDNRFCTPAAVERLLGSTPLVSSWALGLLFDALEKEATPEAVVSESAAAEDLRAAHHREAFATMVHVAQALRSAPAPNTWPEAAFAAQKSSRRPLFDMAKYETESRHYWLRSMAQRLDNLRAILKKESQRVPASTGDANSAWLEAQAQVDGLKADYLMDTAAPGRLRRWLLGVYNPAANLPFALPTPPTPP